MSYSIALLALIVGSAAEYLRQRWISLHTATPGRAVDERGVAPLQAVVDGR